MDKEKLIESLKDFVLGGAIGAFIVQLCFNYKLVKMNKTSRKQAEDALDLANSYKNLYNMSKIADEEDK